MVELFERHIKTLGKHIRDALKEELNRSVVASFATTASINDIRQMQKEVYLMYVLFLLLAWWGYTEWKKKYKSAHSELQKE